jgi:3-hydroxyacyl-CoA dehydrogenase
METFINPLLAPPPNPQNKQQDVAYRIRKGQGLHDPKTRDPATRFTDLQDQLYQQLGRMGQKNGRGWYQYDKAKGHGRTPIPDPEVLAFVERFRREKGIVARTDISDAEILQRSLYALVNEGLRCLGEGVAATASDVDVIWAYGYGFPVWRGGPMHWAEHAVGLPKLLAGLREYHRRFPRSPWLEPAPLLEQLVRKGHGLVARL